MFDGEKSADREYSYRMMVSAVKALVADERNIIACLSNISAIINFYVDSINWSGFYLTEPENAELVLGPFQGLPACIRIKPGTGVCGSAAARGEAIIVPDVDKFPGHIACDSNSRSEIVLPIFLPDGEVYGVLDIDSPVYDRFSDMELRALNEVVGMIEQALAQ